MQEAEGGHVEKLVAQLRAADDRLQHLTRHGDLPCIVYDRGTKRRDGLNGDVSLGQPTSRARIMQQMIYEHIAHYV